jgi:peptide/nickel transport system substrate-binding protein
MLPVSSRSSQSSARATGPALALLSVFICVHLWFQTLAFPAPQEAAAWPKRLTYAAGIVPRGMNPLLDRAGWNEVSSVVLSRLVRPDHKGGIEGDLAESWTVRPDGRVYEVRLRSGVTWHDGAAFTADDVLFTWERLFDAKTETTLDLNQASLAKFWKKDAHTFVFELKAPDSGFPAALTEIAILPAHRLRDADINGDAFDRAMIGTGPYKLVRVEENREFLFTRHETHHHGRPAFEELLIRVIADDDARARAVAEGTADLAHVKPPHVEMLRAKDRSVFRMRTGAWRAMPLNLRRPALQDVRVRQAIDLAIHREGLVEKALQGYGQAAYSPVPPASWAFTPAMNAKRYAPMQAETLLSMAGWTRTNEITGRVGSVPREIDMRTKNSRMLVLHLIVWKDEYFRRTAAEQIERQLAAIGIRVKLHLVDGTTYNRLAENMADQYDGYIGGWGGLLDPGDNLYKKYHSKGSQNRTGYANAEVDKLLEEARRTTDRTKAIPLYEKIVALVTKDAVFLPLAYPDYLFAARAELAGIEDYTLDSWYEFTKYASEWKPK